MPKIPGGLFVSEHHHSQGYHYTNIHPEKDSAGKEWHLDKKVSIFVIVGLLLNFMATTAGMSWMASKVVSEVEQLKARPDLTERVIKLEALTGENGRLLSRLSDVLDRMDTTLRSVATEQARRTTIIRRMEQLPNGQSQH